MSVRKMAAKVKLIALGLLLGVCVAFPLGMNFGRKEPLLSNPLTHVDVRKQVTERVKSGTEVVLESARERIHAATQPLADTD